LMTSTTEGLVRDAPREEPAPAATLPLTFFAVAYTFSWCLWLLPLAAARNWIPWPQVASAIGSAKVPILMAGAFGPFVASFLLTYREGGRRAVLRFAARALRYRIPVGHLCVAMFLCPALAALATYLHSLDGGPPLTWSTPLTSIPTLFILLFFLGGSFQEEFGWAYALDRMQHRWSTLQACVLLGVIWGLWHLPLFFIPGLTQYYMPLWIFLLQTIALRMIAVWIYNAADRSILATLLFHTSVNLSLNLFPLIQHSDNIVQRAWIYFVLLTVAAASPIAWRMNQVRV
jgi:uncharacterized protein